MALIWNPATGEYEQTPDEPAAPGETLTEAEQQARRDRKADQLTAKTVPGQESAQAAATDPAAQQNNSGGYGSTPNGQGPSGFGNAWIRWSQTLNRPPTPSDLARFVREYPEYGATIGGSKGDKVTIGGQTYDAIFSAGDPANSRATWGVAGGNTTAAAGVPGSLGEMAIDPSYLAPFTTPSPTGSPLPGYQAPDPFSYESFGGFDQFNAPTADSILNDPGYLASRKSGMGAIENSAAARGVLNSGGTLYDLGQFGAGLGDQAYGNIWNRDFSAWGAGNQNKLDTYSANRNNAAQNYATNYGVGRDTYQTMLGNNETEYQRAQREWQNTRDTFYSNQTNPFNKLMGLASLGYNAAAI